MTPIGHHLGETTSTLPQDTPEMLWHFVDLAKANCHELPENPAYAVVVQSHWMCRHETCSYSWFLVSLWTILKWIRLRSCGTSVHIFTENRWQRWAAKSQWFFWGVTWLDQPEDSSTWTTLDKLLQIVALRIWIFCRHPGFCHWHDLWFVAWLQQCQQIRCITGWCSW